MARKKECGGGDRKGRPRRCFADDSAVFGNLRGDRRHIPASHLVPGRGNRDLDTFAAIGMKLRATYPLVRNPE
jgi:hypothetical protein